MNLKPCTEAELLAFVAAYPRKLDRDVCQIYDPPLETFNDFALGSWPTSVVAKSWLEDSREDPVRAAEKGWYRDKCRILDDSPLTPNDQQISPTTKDPK